MNICQPKILTQSTSVALEDRGQQKLKNVQQGKMEKKVAGRGACIVPGCFRKKMSKQYCQGHWVRIKRHGDLRPEIPLGYCYGKYSSHWKGGIVNDGHGRILVYTPGHPNASYNGTHVYRYRLVMEKHLGRFLKPEEIVHHKNGIVNDDRIENLELMNQSQHCGIHSSKGSRWAIKFDKCVKCSTTKRKHAAHGMCVNCIMKYKNKI